MRKTLPIAAIEFQVSGITEQELLGSPDFDAMAESGK